MQGRVCFTGARASRPRSQRRKPTPASPSWEKVSARCAQRLVRTAGLFAHFRIPALAGMTGEIQRRRPKTSKNGERRNPFSLHGLAAAVWAFRGFGEERNMERLRVFVRIRIFRISGIFRISIRPACGFRHNRRFRHCEFGSKTSGQNPENPIIPQILILTGRPPPKRAPAPRRL